MLGKGAAGPHDVRRCEAAGSTGRTSASRARVRRVASSARKTPAPRRRRPVRRRPPPPGHRPRRPGSSPHAHARVARIDARAALALPGVLAVFTPPMRRNSGPVSRRWSASRAGRATRIPCLPVRSSATWARQSRSWRLRTPTSPPMLSTLSRRVRAAAGGIGARCHCARAGPRGWRDNVAGVNESAMGDAARVSPRRISSSSPSSPTPA